MGLIYEDNSLEDNNHAISSSGQSQARTQSMHRIACSPTVPLRIWLKAGVSALGFLRKKRSLVNRPRFKTPDLDHDRSVNTKRRRTATAGYAAQRLASWGATQPTTNFVSRMIDKT